MFKIIAIFLIFGIINNRIGDTMKILCLGHVTYDTTIPVDGFPEENEKYHINNKIECGGGPASNAGYLLSKWGEEVYVSGVVGNDYQGHATKEEFERIGANTKYLEINDEVGTDSSYIIANTQNGSRTILTSIAGRKEHPLTLEIHDKFDYIVLDGDEAETAKKVLNNNKEAVSILDAGNLREGTVELSYLVDYLVCSHDYAEDYTNMKMDYDDIDSIIKIYEKMKASYTNKIIITLESRGCFVEIDGEYKIIPSIKINPVDSTGAGDIFHGAFAYFLANGYPLDRVLRLANITGALSVEKLGSRYSMAELNDVLERDKQEENA